MKKGLLTVIALTLALLLAACVTTIPNGLVEKNDLPPPQTTEAIVPETTEAIVPETTEAIVPETTEYIPEETQAQEPTVAQTEPKPTEPKPTEPKPTEPKPTEPAVTTPQNISEEEAKTVAFNHAGVKASQVTHAEVKRDRDDGKTYYDISFIAGNTEYEYEIEAKSGNILHYEKEVKPAAKKTVAEAKAIALNHAGVKEADARELEVETDTQKGKTV